MALNDNAVVTAAVGYVYKAAVGTARPTPAELDAMNPETFGSQTYTLKVTGSPTSGTFVVKVDDVPTSALPANAGPSQVQNAIEALEGIGAGNITVSGTSIQDAEGLEIALVGRLQGASRDITVTGTLTGGTAPAVAVELKAAPNGWENTGHTSRGDMPDFGFEGGDAEIRGTWQNARLREVVTEAVADYLTLFLHQFDTDTFELYYGANASAEKGIFGVSGDASVNEHAFLVVIVDGPNRIGFYVPKASVRRDDSIQMPVDDFTAFPIRATFLKLGTRNLFEWISEDLFD